jgi:hypothetical protein
MASTYTRLILNARHECIPKYRLHSCLSRTFATTYPKKQDTNRSQQAWKVSNGSLPKPGVSESIKPESLQKKDSITSQKQDPLLAEQTVSNKEQRKADWAIMKEMSQYLWPKVGLNLKTNSIHYPEESLGQPRGKSKSNGGCRTPRWSQSKIIDRWN